MQATRSRIQYKILSFCIQIIWIIFQLKIYWSYFQSLQVILFERRELQKTHSILAGDSGKKGRPNFDNYSLIKQIRYSLGKEKCCCPITHLPSRFFSTPVHLAFSQLAGWPAQVLISSKMQPNQIARFWKIDGQVFELVPDIFEVRIFKTSEFFLKWSDPLITLSVGWTLI